MQKVTPKQAMLELLTVLLGTQSSAGSSTSTLESLMPVLATGYGATMSPTDRATLHLMQLLNAQRQVQQADAMEVEEAPSKAEAWLTEGFAGMG